MVRFIGLFIATLLWLMLPFHRGVVLAQSSLCDSDIDQDGVVDLSDYSILVANFLKTNSSHPRTDINKDGITDIGDYSILVTHFLQTASCGGQGQNVVLNLSKSSGPYRRFQKIEWTFDLPKTYPNPYYFYDPSDTPANNPSTMSWFGVDGVSVDLNVTAPSGKTFKVPGFWMEDYLRMRNGNLQYLGKKDNGRWHIRFTPEEEGTYTYTISIADKTGTSTTTSESLTVSGTNGKGFVRTSPVDSRFMSYSDGTTFVPIGSGAQWWENNGIRSYSYEEMFNTFGANNINFTRIWDQSDFALGVEGAQPVWLAHNTVYGTAVGTEINSSNVHSGMRAARPAAGTYWYQRIAIAEPNKEHTLKAWIKTSSVSGGQARVQITNISGTVVGQTTAVTGTTGWTEYSTTFIPGTQLAQIRLSFSGGSGVAYFDDIAFGPTEDGQISYNIISDPDIERHFAKDNPNNDPNSTPTLPRPLGTFMNPWSSYDLDKIIESADANNVKIQLCSCSGPWFTWPQNNDSLNSSEPWVLKSWQRNFRYRVARWGYSPAILAWEQYNERGHVTLGSSLFTFIQNYGNYQKATDPYNHLRTTSQNSQAYSPGMWSSSAMDISNYHDYLDFRSSTYANISNDEVLFIQRFSWCLTDTRGPSSPYCQGLGLGDGSTWSGPAKPWIWGEIGVQSGGANIQGGEAGRRFLHNIVWAGLISPMGTTPLDWFQGAEDTTSRTGKYSARKAASTFFNSFNYASARFSFFTSSQDKPPGYTGETIGVSDNNVRAYGMKSQDKKLVVLWVTHRNNIWSKASTPLNTTVSPTITVPGVLNQSYTVETWNTTTGQIINTQQVTASGSTLNVATSFTSDVALKIYTQ